MYKVLLEQVSERLNEIYKDVEATVQDCEYERLQTGSDILERIVYERLRDIQEIDSKSMEYYSLVEKLESLIPIQEQIKILLNDLPAIFKDFFENEDKSEEETNETPKDLLRKACGNQNVTLTFGVTSDGNKKFLTADGLRRKWEFFEDGVKKEN